MSTALLEVPKIDFSQWQRENLEAFANECYARNQQLEEDLRTALDAYRKLVRKGAKDE